MSKTSAGKAYAETIKNSPHNKKGHKSRKLAWAEYKKAISGKDDDGKKYKG